jgi:hypothetical protein
MRVGLEAKGTGGVASVKAIGGESFVIPRRVARRHVHTTVHT